MIAWPWTRSRTSARTSRSCSPTWAGRSPRDIEDQITYPLTTQLLGLPGVRTVRSSSMFGFSTIYVIFEDGIEFYWSRSRILEKLAALPQGTLPAGRHARARP